MHAQQKERDFHQAAGECFSEAICPPAIPRDASPHECCEVLWEQLGNHFTPTTLASLSEAEKAGLTCAFANYFECEIPTIQQIEMAVKRTIARWPLDEFN